MPVFKYLSWGCQFGRVAARALIPACGPGSCYGTVTFWIAVYVVIQWVARRAHQNVVNDLLAMVIHLGNIKVIWGCNWSSRFNGRTTRAACCTDVSHREYPPHHLFKCPFHGTTCHCDRAGGDQWRLFSSGMRFTTQLPFDICFNKLTICQIPFMNIDINTSYINGSRLAFQSLLAFSRPSPALPWSFS